MYLNQSEMLNPLTLLRRGMMTLKVHAENSQIKAYVQLFTVILLWVLCAQTCTQNYWLKKPVVQPFLFYCLA